MSVSSSLRHKYSQKRSFTSIKSSTQLFSNNYIVEELYIKKKPRDYQGRHHASRSSSTFDLCAVILDKFLR
jgi:hypothetical protein